MSILPSKNLFIVTSALKPTIGKFNVHERLSQTIETLKSIRKHDPMAFILLVDCSTHQIDQKDIEVLTPHINCFFDLSADKSMRELSENGMKSQAETVMLLNVILLLKNNPEFQKLMHSVRRIFKISGRYSLQESFRIAEHDNCFGKFIFRKRIPTWMNSVMFGATDLLITRFYSFCPSLIDTYFIILQKNLELLNHMDTEHAHFVNIPKDLLVEFEKIHCQGQVASTGEWHYD